MSAERINPELQEDDECDYYAFISYSRHDHKIAHWLQNNLEAYSLPTALKKQFPQLPRKLRPSFLDKNDIGLNWLKSELREKLRLSRFLIVICSPHSAQSYKKKNIAEGQEDWIGFEIENFIEMGRAKNIILLIVDGIPRSGAEDTECFHPIIRQHLPHGEDAADSLLAANIHEDTHWLAYVRRKKAFIRVVARMHGLNYNALWDRHKRAVRMSILKWATAAIAVFSPIVWWIIVWQVFTMALVLKEQTPHNPNLPFKESTIELRLGNDWVSKSVNNMHDPIIFKDIAPRYKGERVEIRWKSHGVIARNSHIVLSETVDFPIERDACYGTILGVVRDEDSDALLADVTVSTGEVSTTTDAQGRFKLTIPLQEQKEKYDLELKSRDKTSIFPDAWPTQYRDDVINTCYFKSTHSQQ